MSLEDTDVLDSPETEQDSTSNDNSSPNQSRTNYNKLGSGLKNLNKNLSQNANPLRNRTNFNKPAQELAKEVGKQLIKEGAQEAAKSGIAVLFGPPFIGEIVCGVIL